MINDKDLDRARDRNRFVTYIIGGITASRMR